MTELVSKREFATRIGQSPSYVTQLLHDGRLILEGTGRSAKVKVSESLKRIEQTGGGRPDVAARHARNRANGGASDSGIEDEEIGGNYQAHRAIKEKYAALTAKAEYETLIGNLIPRDDVDSVLRFVGAQVRSLMDVFLISKRRSSAPYRTFTKSRHCLQMRAAPSCWTLAMPSSASCAQLPKNDRNHSPLPVHHGCRACTAPCPAGITMGGRTPRAVRKASRRARQMAHRAQSDIARNYGLPVGIKSSNRYLGDEVVTGWRDRGNR